MKLSPIRILFLPCFAIAMGLGPVLTVAAVGDLGATADLIAAQIARDHGGIAADHRDYALRLAQTLSRLSPEAQERVLRKHAGSVGLGEGNGLPDGTGGGDPTGGDPTGGDPSGSDPTGSDPTGGNPGEESPPSVDDQGLLDLLNQRPPMSGRDLKNALIAASPLSDAVMEATLSRTPPMTSGDLKAILERNGPLAPSVVAAAIERRPSMSSSDLESVLIGNVPLSAENLALVENARWMSSSDRQTVIDAHNEAAGN